MRFSHDRGKVQYNPVSLMEYNLQPHGVLQHKFNSYTLKKEVHIRVVDCKYQRCLLK